MFLLLQVYCPYDEPRHKCNKGILKICLKNFYQLCYLTFANKLSLFDVIPKYYYFT